MIDTVEPRRAAPPQGREIGGLISGVFGVVFVAVNSSALAFGPRLPLLVAAGITVALILFFIVRNLRIAGPPQKGGRRVFGRSYWAIVAIEALALFGGTRLLVELGHPELGVAWVSFVVGTHFFALGRIFRLTRFHLLAVLVTVCGLIGFAVVGFESAILIAVISGVVPGFLLLAFGLWAVAPRP